MSFSESIRRKVAALPSAWRQFSYILLLALLATIVSSVLFKPAKTNRVYLAEIIENHALEKTATELVSRLRASPETKNLTDSDWQRMEEGLTACLVRQARLYAASDDPYLSVRANMETPTIFANRFLRACGALD